MRDEQAHGPNHWVQAGAMTFGAGLAFAFLPVEPGFLDRIRPRPAIDIRQVKQLSETPALRAPALGGVVTEHLGIERLKGSAAVRARTFSGVDRHAAGVVEREEAALSQLQRLIHPLLRSFRRFSSPRSFAFQDANHDLDVVLAETIEPKPLRRVIHFSVRADFRVAVLGGPFRHIGVEPLPVADHRREEEQVSAAFELRLQTLAELIARLGLDRDLAIGAKLRSEPGEEQAQEVVDFGDGGDGALAPAPGRALLDADRRGQAGDQIHVRAGELFHKLPRVGIHGIEEATLALGEEQIEREGALARTAHARNDHELIPRDGEREILQVMLARPVNRNHFIRSRRELFHFLHTLAPSVLSRDLADEPR